MANLVALKPRINEKTYGLSAQRVYVMEVAKNVNKLSVAKAVEEQYEVKVTKVNMTNIPGKAKRTISINGKRARNSEGVRSDIKKAYVTLAEGYSLPFFNAVEEADEKQEATQAKIDKAAAKIAEKADKDAKPKTSRLGLRRGTKDDATEEGTK